MAIVEILENGYPMPRMPMGMYPMGAVPGIGDQIDDHFKRHWLKYLIAAGLIGRSGMKKYNAYDQFQQQTSHLMNVQNNMGQLKKVISDPNATPEQKQQATQAYDSLSKQYGGEPGLQLQLSQLARQQADAGNTYKNSFLGMLLPRGVKNDADSILGKNQQLPGTDVLTQYNQQQADAQVAAQQAEAEKQQQAANATEDAYRKAMGMDPLVRNMSDDDQLKMVQNMGPDMTLGHLDYLMKNNQYVQQNQDQFLNTLQLKNKALYDQYQARKNKEAAPQQPAQPAQPAPQAPTDGSNQPAPQAAPVDNSNTAAPQAPVGGSNPSAPQSPLGGALDNAAQQAAIEKAKADMAARQQADVNTSVQRQFAANPGARPEQMLRKDGTGRGNPNTASTPNIIALSKGLELNDKFLNLFNEKLDINKKILLIDEVENPDYDNYQDNQQDSHQDNGQEDDNDNKVPEDNKSDDKPTFFQKHKKKILAGGAALLGSAAGIHIAKNNHINKAAEYAVNANTIDPKDNHRSILKANLMTKAVDHGIKGKILNKYDIVQKVKDSFNKDVADTK